MLPCSQPEGIGFGHTGQLVRLERAHRFGAPLAPVRSSDMSQSFVVTTASSTVAWRTSDASQRRRGR